MSEQNNSNNPYSKSITTNNNPSASNNSFASFYSAKPQFENTARTLNEDDLKMTTSEEDSD